MEDLVMEDLVMADMIDTETEWVGQKKKRFKKIEFVSSYFSRPS